MTAAVWVDGALRPADQAHLSVLDHAFTVGDAVFETMKSVDGVPFALSRHLDRLEGSARGLGLGEPDRGEVRAAVDAVLAQPEVPAAARVRITYGGGVAPMGSGRGAGDCRLVVVAAPAPAWDLTTRVVTVPWVRNERSAVAGLKTTSYAENVVALERARQSGATEALLANTRDELCEGTGSNVFVVIDGVALTPPLTSGCLPGITRALVLEWCGSVAHEAVVPWADLDRADEVFLTSSTRDVQAVSAVDGRVIPGAPGPVTRGITDAFANRAAENVDP